MAALDVLSIMCCLCRATTIGNVINITNHSSNIEEDEMIFLAPELNVFKGYHFESATVVSCFPGTRDSGG